MAKAQARITADSSDFQKQMKEMVEQMKHLSSEFGVAQAEAKLFGDASDVLKSKVAELTAKIELQKDVVKANDEQHDRLTAKLEKEKEKHAELTQKLKEAKTRYEEAAKQTNESSEETEKLAAEVKTLEDKLGTCTVSIEKQEKSLEAHENKTNKAKIALANMEGELKDVNAELAKMPWDNFSKGADKVSSVTGAVGEKMMVASTAIVAAGTYSAKTAIEFESAFAGVKKTVDATDEELATLKQGIIDMSKELPASATEIASVAEAAGQLGIKTEDILSFTRVMIDLGESTNLSADEAASALAKFANVVKMDAGNYQNLGSTIVALGNNFATTEADIVSMATRLASTGEVVGLSEPQIMAIATALSSVGIDAEAGGSAVSKLLKQMEVAVQTYGTASEVIDSTGYSLRDLQLMASLNSGEFKAVAESLGLTTNELKGYMENASSLEQFAEVADMSSDQFIEAWGKDAVGAMSTFIGGLNDTERMGRSAVEILNGMGITEIRLSNAVLALASSDGILNDTLAVSNRAWDENNALSNEAEQRYSTTESRIEKTKNQVTALAVSFGEKLLPVVEKGINKISELAERFEGLSDDQQETIIKVGGVVAAIGPALLAFSKLSGGVSSVASVIGKLAGGIAGSGGLSGVLSALCSPVGLVVAAIAALVAGLAYVVATNDDVRASLMDVLDKLGNALQPAMEFFTGTVLPDLQNAWKSLQEMLAPLAKFIEEALTDCWTEFLIPALDYLAETVIPTATSTFENLWQNVIVPLSGFLESFLTPTIEKVSEVLTMLWQNVILPLANFLGTVFSKAWESYMKILNENVIPKIERTIEVIQFLWDKILKPVTDWLWNTLKPSVQNTMEYIGNLFNALKKTLTGLIDFITGIFTGDWSQAWSGIKDIFGGLWDTVKAKAEEIKDQLGSVFSGIGDALKEPISKAKTSVVTTFNTLKSTINKVINAIKEKVSEVFNGIKSAIETPIKTARDTVSDVIDKIKSFFNITLSFKGIKLPHFKITYDTSGLMAEACQLLGLKGVPKFSVEWYRSGGIMMNPTVFGLSGQTVLAGGEAGPEAILPLEPFYERLSAILDRKFEKLMQSQTIHVTVVNTLDGEVIAEHTTEIVTGNIVEEMRSRRFA